jgi:ABC-type lipoprotein export system ATPase subunit
MTLIKLTGIRKSFGDGGNRLNEVLRGIDMDVAAGEFVAIRGASGSGKTTLLAILGTLLAPDSGVYLLDGQEITAMGADLPAIRNGKIGFVFQDHRLLPQYTAMENILLPALANSAEASREQVEYAEELMELTNIGGVVNQYTSTLSGGESSRVAVCRALIMKPLLVLADEPTGQLDAENARNIAMLLAEINRKLNTTVIMATHSEETSSAAHRILKLMNGILT